MNEGRKFGGDAIQAIRTASQAHYHLSAMADRKASMLMGASFVVFTISVTQASARGELPVKFPDDGLRQALMRGDVPDYLEPVSAGDVFKVWRVR